MKSTISPSTLLTVLRRIFRRQEPIKTLLTPQDIRAATSVRVWADWQKLITPPTDWKTHDEIERKIADQMAEACRKAGR